MKKAVITILGTIGSKFDPKLNRLVLDRDSVKSIYNSKNISTMQNRKHINTLGLLIESYNSDYEIIPIFTEVARDIQRDVLKELEDIKSFENIFKDEYKIEDENEFQTILTQIDSIVNRYDKIIVDISHGFRHLPILMTIDLIMQNIKSNRKIERILFAQEIVKPDKFKKIEGRYEIVDLKDYLDLTNLSFIITNFKDNYTISSKIKVTNAKYQPLIRVLNEFSRDIMALSLENIYVNSYENLIIEIEKIENDFILKSDLINLKEHLVEHFGNYGDRKRYENYLKLSKDFNQKNYLLQAITVLNEAKVFYLKSAIKSKSGTIQNYIEEIESRIEKSHSDKISYYHLNKELRDIYIIKNYRPKQNYLIQDSAVISKIKQTIGFNLKFKEFLFSDLRNKLAHANSKGEIDNVKAKISNEINKLENYIRDNILGVKGAI